jgi:4-hydroxyphenylpyruvate dioxygenase-like putative hemolysin
LKQGRVQSIINKNREGSSRHWNLVRKHSTHVAAIALKEKAVATATEKWEEQQDALASIERKHSVLLAREQTALGKQLQVAKQLEVDLLASSIQTEKVAAEAEQRLQEQRELIERLQAKGKSFEEELQSRNEGLANALAEKATETDSQLKQNEEQHRKALHCANP